MGATDSGGAQNTRSPNDPETTIVLRNDMTDRFNHWTTRTWKDVGTPPSGRTLFCRVHWVEVVGSKIASSP